MAYTLTGLMADARNILNDVVQESGANRYSDQMLVNAFNDALVLARARRPDAFLSIGLRNPLPTFLPTDFDSYTNTPFPLASEFYPAFLFYVVGRTELIDDTFADDGRAVTLMNKFVGQLMQVAS